MSDETMMRLGLLDDADAELVRNYMTARKIILDGKEWKWMAMLLLMEARHYDAVAMMMKMEEQPVIQKELGCCCEALSRGGRGVVNTAYSLTGHRDHT